MSHFMEEHLNQAKQSNDDQKKSDRRMRFPIELRIQMKYFLYLQQNI